MEMLVGVLGGLALALAGGVGWLLLERARLMARAAQVGAERDAAAGDAEAARAEAAELKVSLAETAARLAQAETHAAVVAEKVSALEGARRDDLLHHEERVKQAEANAHELARARLEAANETLAAARKLVADTERATREAFGALSAQALQANNAQFLALAQQKLGGTLAEGAAAVKQQRDAVETLVKPVGDTLKETRDKLSALEALTASMGTSNADLRTQTEQLVRALREPKVRGAYGEIQLRRVAEIAGMRAYCDFVEQDSTRDAEGNALRPDMIVRLPNGRDVVVDAKANLRPYVDAFEVQGDPEAQEACLERFAAGIEKQARALGAKGYWKQYDGSPEFVVMFVPGDQYVDAALARRPGLIETAAQSRVILASPSTLIALLQAVHVAFRERDVALNAQALLELARELHERLATAMRHVESVGKAIAQAGTHYDRFVGSYEKRLLPQMRKMEDFNVSSGEPLPELEPLHVTVRALPGAAAGAGEGAAADTGASTGG